MADRGELSPFSPIYRCPICRAEYKAAMTAVTCCISCPACGKSLMTCQHMAPGFVEQLLAGVQREAQ